MKRLRVVGVVLILTSTILPAGLARAEFSCTSGTEAAGGDWTVFGREPGGSRNQVSEDLINPANVGTLEVAWVFNSASSGSFVANVSVAGNCAYFMDAPEYSQGSVWALNAATGDLVWQVPVFADEAPATSGSWANRGSVAVVNGRVHVNGHSKDGPDSGGFFGASAAKALAFDANSGERLWTTDPIEFGYTTQSDGGPAVYDGIHLIMTNGPDADPSARPGYALIDAATGEPIHMQTTIPTEDLDNGYAGGGVWTTPAVANGYAYAGTANPDSRLKEHAYDNAFVKIDLHRDSPTFGEVVGHFKGNYDDGTTEGVAYGTAGCQAGLDAGVIFNQACGQLDIDFSTAPTTVTLDDGRTLLAEMQKDGTFWVVDADTMELVWSRKVSSWVSFQGNQGAAATDGVNFYVPANPGVLWAFDVETGETAWVAPVADGLPHHHVSMANGVVYYLGNHGKLLGFNAADGSLVLQKDLTVDAGLVCQTPWSSAVTIAHNTVYAPCDMGPDGGLLVAYRLPS